MKAGRRRADARATQATAIPGAVLPASVMSGTVRLGTVMSGTGTPGTVMSGTVAPANVMPGTVAPGDTIAGDTTEPGVRLAGTPLKIGMLCHSTNPRGGVAHAMAVAEALCARGHEVLVHAPDPDKRGFPRQARCSLVSVPAAAVATGGLAALVEQRIAEYIAYFSGVDLASFDILHAHDGIGANALLSLRKAGRIPGFVRTVHHLDAFTDTRLAEWQDNSVREAEAVACVSRVWRDVLARQFGTDAQVVSNGVDLKRFSPTPNAGDQEMRARFELDARRPLVLAVGGIEARKNSARILEAFLRLRRHQRDARLLIVGGASLLDHSPARQAFLQILAESDLGSDAESVVTVTGPLPDACMAALYRCADVLCFPSLHEGFGLVTLEALACGTPVVTSRIPPFTEYLSDAHVRFAQAESVSSIAMALEAALDPWNRAIMRASGFALTRRMSWDRCADAHEHLYQQVLHQRSGGAPFSPDPDHPSDDAGPVPQRESSHA